MQSRLMFALKISQLVYIYIYIFSFFKKIRMKKKNLIPDITVRSRIGAHEDLDRFFGIIEESLEFLFCGRFARGWNLDIFNVDQTCNWVCYNARSNILTIYTPLIALACLEEACFLRQGKFGTGNEIRRKCDQEKYQLFFTFSHINFGPYSE